MDAPRLHMTVDAGQSAFGRIMNRSTSPVIALGVCRPERECTRLNPATVFVQFMLKLDVIKLIQTGASAYNSVMLDSIFERNEPRRTP